MPTAVHTINFRGLSGGIFGLLSIATILYVIGFATNAWAIRGASEGLWETCSCIKNTTQNKPVWFTAVQAMMAIGFIGMLLAFVLMCIYMCVHSISKNTIILAVVIVCFVTVLVMVIGVVIYGVKREDTVSWSFAVSIASAILCLVAGILSIVQMRKSGA